MVSWYKKFCFNVALATSLLASGNSSAAALNCADLQTESEIYIFFGCAPELSAETVSARFESLSPSGKLFGRWAFLLSEQEYPLIEERENFVTELLSKNSNDITAADLIFAEAVSYLDPRIKPHISNLDLAQRAENEPDIQAAALNFAWRTNNPDLLGIDLVEMFEL